MAISTRRSLATKREIASERETWIKGKELGEPVVPEPAEPDEENAK